MRTIDIYLLLLVGIVIYATILAHFRHLWEPDLTVLEVAIGVFLCLLAPYTDLRINGPYTAEVYELRVWQCFWVGGAVIGVWQISQSVRAWRRISKRIWRRDGESSAEALAGERGGRAERDD